MQLVAYGAQDIYLTGNPQITFFKVVYRRHTNFAMESIEQTFNGAANLGQKFSCTIARNGDLLSQVYLEMDVSLTATSHTVDSVKLTSGANTYTLDVAAAAANNKASIAGAGNVITLTDNASATATVQDGTGDINSQSGLDGLNETKVDTSNGGRRVGLRAIDYVEVEIGGQCIDKHYGDWMDIWAGLTYSNEKWTKWNTLVNAKLNANASGKNKLYIPLQFWFCRNPGLALPLIALQYHEVKLNVQFNPSVTYTHVQTTTADDANTTLVLSAGASLTDGTNIFTTAGSTVEISRTVSVSMSIDNCCVFCDYIFLDTDERRRFAQVSHEYLIEQVQFSNALTLSSGNDQHELRFNHPVKELVWACQTSANSGNNFNYFNGTGDMINSALLQLNGHDRMKRREGTYFRCVQPYQHHTGADGQSSSSEWGGYYTYSFGLKPEEHQPSGTCNFSRIDNAVLSLNASASGSIKVYAVNYNVLRIMSGMGGLAYSN
jgi:hypothetical protein